jgi:hypothetical protein
MAVIGIYLPWPAQHLHTLPPQVDLSGQLPTCRGSSHGCFHLCQHVHSLLPVPQADFFGERALLCDEPRMATVEALTDLTCLVLDRETFIQVLGPWEQVLAREKSPQVGGAGLANVQKAAQLHRCIFEGKGGGRSVVGGSSRGRWLMWSYIAKRHTGFLAGQM